MTVTLLCKMTAPAHTKRMAGGEAWRAELLAFLAERTAPRRTGRPRIHAAIVIAALARLGLPLPLRGGLRALCHAVPAAIERHTATPAARARLAADLCVALDAAADEWAREAERHAADQDARARAAAPRLAAALRTCARWRLPVGVSEARSAALFGRRTAHAYVADVGACSLLTPPAPFLVELAAQGKTAVLVADPATAAVFDGDAPLADVVRLGAEEVHLPLEAVQACEEHEGAVAAMRALARERGLACEAVLDAVAAEADLALERRLDRTAFLEHAGGQLHRYLREAVQVDTAPEVEPALLPEPEAPNIC